MHSAPLNCQRSLLNRGRTPRCSPPVQDPNPLQPVAAMGPSHWPAPLWASRPHDRLSQAWRCPIAGEALGAVAVRFRAGSRDGRQGHLAQRALRPLVLVVEPPAVQQVPSLPERLKDPVLQPAVSQSRSRPFRVLTIPLRLAAPEALSSAPVPRYSHQHHRLAFGFGTVIRPDAHRQAGDRRQRHQHPSASSPPQVRATSIATRSRLNASSTQAALPPRSADLERSA